MKDPSVSQNEKWNRFNALPIQLQSFLASLVEKGCNHFGEDYGLKRIKDQPDVLNTLCNRQGQSVLSQIHPRFQIVDLISVLLSIQQMGQSDDQESLYLELERLVTSNSLCEPLKKRIAAIKRKVADDNGRIDLDQFLKSCVHPP